jgi:hypothetical protein
MTGSLMQWLDAKAQIRSGDILKGKRPTLSLHGRSHLFDVLDSGSGGHSDCNAKFDAVDGDMEIHARERIELPPELVDTKKVSCVYDCGSSSQPRVQSADIFRYVRQGEKY